MLDQILQNTSDKIEVDIYFNNVLTAPDSISIREIRDPDGTVILNDVSPVTGSTIGRYEYTLALAYTTKLGIYSAIWRFTIGTSTFEHTQYFEVVSSFRDGYISPYELRQKAVYDAITSTEPTDAVLQKYIDRSTDIIDTYLGGSINYAIYSEVRRCVLDKVHNGIHVQLAHRPIVSLTSVILTQGPTETLTLDTTYVRMNKNAGYLEYFSDIAAPTLRICVFDPSATSIIPEATVVYTAGYVTVPKEVKTAATMIVEELLRETNGDDKRLQRFAIDKISETYTLSKSEEAAVSELGLKNVHTILKLLRPYRQSYKTLPFAGPLG